MTVVAARDLTSPWAWGLHDPPGMMATSGDRADASREAPDARAVIRLPAPARLSRGVRELAAFIIESPYMICEIIRIDGALRVPPA